MKLNIGSKITEYRVKSGMTQQEFADKLNIHRSTVSSWERDRTEPRMGDMEKMCQLFGCKLSELLPVEIDVIYDQMNAEQKERLLSYAKFIISEGE